MDLWGPLGISRETALACALGGLALAALMGIGLLLRRTKKDEGTALRLRDEA